MKTIEQEKAVSLEISETKFNGLKIAQGFGDYIVVKKDGAKQLIEILKEWVGENS